MKYHSQNLTDGRLPLFWHGRAWLHQHGCKPGGRTLHWEWMFGKFARDFAVTLSFGNGDNDDGVLFHVCIPWFFSIYIGLNGVLRCKECKTGIAVHNSAVWLYPLTYVMDNNREDPWYRRYLSLAFPWELQWYRTEILAHGPNTKELRVEWLEQGRHGDWEERRLAEHRVSRNYRYAYILKNRDIQYRTATVYVSRIYWRSRWWPLIPRRKVETSINVTFDKEVGEGSGSWKGGCVGCGYTMKWGETPERCLSRMEHEREFRR